LIINRFRISPTSKEIELKLSNKENLKAFLAIPNKFKITIVILFSQMLKKNFNYSILPVSFAVVIRKVIIKLGQKHRAIAYRMVSNPSDNTQAESA